MKIDKFKINVRGFTEELESQLDREQDAIITMQVGIPDVSTPSNEDGTYNAVYKAKKNGSFEIRQTEKVIKGKDKTKKSQQLRAKIYWEAEGRNVVDHEGFYEAVMNQLLIDPKYIDEAISKVNIEQFR